MSEATRLIEEVALELKQSGRGSMRKKLQKALNILTCKCRCGTCQIGETFHNPPRLKSSEIKTEDEKE